MTANVRLATESDASGWLHLLKASIGEQFPGIELINHAWATAELNLASGHETWIVEAGGTMQSAISLLRPAEGNTNPVVNLGRNLCLPESYQNNSAAVLLQKISELGRERKQMIVARVPVTDNSQQILYENFGYVCVGFQPSKHRLKTRQGVLFYLLPANPVLITRLPLSDSLSQISGLAMSVLENLKLSTQLSVRDGVTGYPLHSDLTVHDAIFEDFELWRAQAHDANPAREVSGGFNLGSGLLRINTDSPVRAMLGQRDSQIVSGLAYFNDELDQCVRVFDAFASDYLSIGPLLAHLVKVAQEKLGAVYVEIDILMQAHRLLRCAEQLGFVPVAYLPAFNAHQRNFADVVKMVKLNLIYSPVAATLTAQAATMVRSIDSSVRDMNVGVAIVNMLRSLSIFSGLGDGELRKIGRLFHQKLYRKDEVIFRNGDAGNQAYVVLRGKVDILLDEKPEPIACLESGKIFGELAFLDGAARGATALAVQPSILLVMERTAFQELIESEPHLGMVVLRNIAVDLASKLRCTTNALH